MICKQQGSKGKKELEELVSSFGHVYESDLGGASDLEESLLVSFDSPGKVSVGVSFMCCTLIRGLRGHLLG